MDAEKSRKIGWGKALSSIRMYVEKRTPTIFALVVIALMTANLHGTYRNLTVQERILAQGIIAHQPQLAITEWTDVSRMKHRVETPRMPSESADHLGLRHQEAVSIFSATFEPER